MNRSILRQIGRLDTGVFCNGPWVNPLSVRRSYRRTGCPIFGRRPRGKRGPDASAQSVWRDARLSRNVRQPNHVLANMIGGNKAEWWPRAGEEWLAATKHDGVEVESILINKTKVG